MKFLKQNAGHIVLCLFEGLVGVLLLVDPEGLTSGIITAGGILLLIVGIAGIVKYFRTEALEAAAGQTLTKGLAALLGGAFCIFRSQWFIVTFPALTIVYGVAVLAAGLGKVQAAVDRLRQNKRWGWTAVGAAVSLVCAFVILSNPFSSAIILWTFTGVSLIAEAVFDAVSLIVGRPGGNRDAAEA